MVALLLLGLGIAALAAFDYAALRWGVDTRVGFPDGRKPKDILSVR